MTALRGIGAGLLAGVLAMPIPAYADVTVQTDQGFVSRNVLEVAGTPAAVWKRLLVPSSWWSSDHTFSGDAANLALDPVPGGCFCEKLPADDADAPKVAKPGTPRPAARGGVEHMRVVYVDREKALRMVGALGPLQSEAVNATLTVTLKAVDGGTRVIFEYVVGGYMRYPADKIAASVDTVMGNQLISLAEKFGPVAARPATGAPTPATSGAKLDKNGLLLPRGKIWSLPSGPAPETARPALPAAPTDAAAPLAPLPTAPVQEDITPAGGIVPTKAQPQPDSAKPKLAAPSKASKARNRPTPVADPVPHPVPDAAPAALEPAPAAILDAPAATTTAKLAPKSATAKRNVAKPVAKPTAKPAPASDEPSKDSINSAFDAAFGGAPRPAPDAQ